MRRKRFPARKLEALLKKFGGKCATCGCEITPASGLEWDHIKPISMGGADDLSNLQPLCAKDHRIKTAAEVAPRLRADAQRHRALGLREPKSRIPSPPRVKKEGKPRLPPRQLFVEGDE